MNPAGSVSATSPKEPCPSAVIVTVTWPPASTGSGEKDLLALGSPASGEVVPVSPSPVSGGVVVAATIMESPRTCTPLNASKSASTPLKTPVKE